MNLIDIEDRLKDLSDQQLMQQMQRPDGMAPQFLVMSELKRRKEMRGRAPTQPDTSTVKDDLLGQGIASAMPQQPMPQQPMPQQPMSQQPMPQDGIPRFSGGVFLQNPPSQAPRPQYRQPFKFFGRIGDKAYGYGPRIHSSLTTENDLSAATESGVSPVPNDVSVMGHKDVGMGLSRDSAYPLGFVPFGSQMNAPTQPPGTYNSTTLAQNLAETDDEQILTGADTSLPRIYPITNEMRNHAGFFPNQDVGTSANTTSTSANNEVKPRVAGLKTVRRGSPPYSGGYDNQYGEVDAASDNQRMIYQLLSAPSATSDAPAAPAQNYYEGIEKKLAALQAAETGPDAGMALLRAGLGMAQAGGEGKSTAAAIGAGGIAGLDAYEAQKKSSDARAMELLGVESELAGAKTKQSYDQQSLALQARQRDISEKALKLNALGQLNDNETRLIIAKSSDDLKRVSLDLERIKIDDAARTATEKLRIMEDEGVVKKGYYESIVRKNDKGDAIDRFIAAPPEIRELIKPLLVKANGSALMGKIGNSAMELVAEPLWLADTKDRLTKELGRPATMDDAVAEARRLAETGYGVRQFRQQKNNDPVPGVRR